ncbi:MAG: nucleotide exchange factor GrpE [Bacteroidota bacterium]|nr:nucleotide exchange factor GrpE [Bacteroidota bacterium]MDP4205334.1 nucleotide exchange factor GrpE [Bacteroidota bacterium]
MENAKQAMNEEQKETLNTEPQNESEVKAEAGQMPEAEETAAGQDVTSEEHAEKPKSHKHKKEDHTKELESKIEELQDKYLRLSAEFDNYRKRTLREKTELIKTAGEGILINILPVIDDFERARTAMQGDGTSIEAIRDGVDLIYNKFSEFLKQNGVVEIESANQDFNTDIHEALTKIPAPAEELKGKVVDVIQKGYLLNEKVIRFAKVVVGE